MKVPYVDLASQWLEDREELLPVIEGALASGQYILGREVERLEQSLAELCGVQYCVTLNSGTDALVIALHALGVGPGDEVITPPNSFIASTAAIAHVGAVPVFTDVLEDQNIDPDQVRRAISPRTKAVMPVHLTGRLCRMDHLSGIAQEFGLPIIEDAAQAIASRFLNRASGSWGEVACFSCHPLKNLAAAGDAGFLVTSNSALAEKARRFRNHGLADRNIASSFGVVSRMDGIQAAILHYRLGKLESIVERRRRNADQYFAELSGTPVLMPLEKSGEFNTYHTFVIQTPDRDRLRDYLTRNGVGTAIHYPIPLHLQPAVAKYGYTQGSFPVAERQADHILSLPIHQNLNREEISYVSTRIREFFASK